MLSAILLAAAAGMLTSGASTHAQGPSLTLRASDYPREAREKQETGRAIVRFLVDERGRVAECSVVASSGSAALDRTTCNIARRGRFKPARDASGAPQSEYWRWGIDWQSPVNPSVRADYAAPETVYLVTQGALPAAAASIDIAVGTANWATMPSLVVKRYPPSFGAGANVKVNGLVANKACVFKDARPGHFDIDVRYAVRVSPEGKAERGLVEDVGCPPLQRLVASMILDRPFLDAIDAPGGTETRWYQSMIRFSEH